MCISLEQMHSLARKLRGMIRREMVEPASQLMNLYEAAERLGCFGKRRFADVWARIPIFYDSKREFERNCSGKGDGFVFGQLKVLRIKYYKYIIINKKCILLFLFCRNRNLFISLVIEAKDVFQDLENFLNENYSNLLETQRDDLISNKISIDQCSIKIRII